MTISDDLRLVAQAQAQIIADEVRTCDLYITIAESVNATEVVSALRHRRAETRQELQALVYEYFPEMAALFGVAKRQPSVKQGTARRARTRKEV